MNVKINISVLLSFVIALIFLASWAVAQDDEIENMLSNPDFEEGLTGWSISAQWGTLSIDKKEESPSGHPVMMATINDVGANAWEPEIHSPTFAVENGEQYTVDFWAKTEPGSVRPIGVKFEQLDTWTGPAQTFTLTEEWQQIVFSPVMTMDSPPAVVIHIQFNNIKDDVWFSHFRVYEGEFMEEELGLPKIAVNPQDRLSITWGHIKGK
jgi:hypothetical protein